MASPLRITSSRIRGCVNAVKLRESKHRRNQGLFLIDGHKSIELAIQSGVKLREIFLREGPTTPRFGLTVCRRMSTFLS